MTSQCPNEFPRITRVWAMPNRYTFKVPPLLEIVLRYMGNGHWLDPFAGCNSPAAVTNDLDPNTPAQFHLEAVEFCRQQPGPFDGAIFDPPYSLTKLARCYPGGRKGASNPTGGFPLVRDELSRLVRPDGHVVSFGWNSVGMGIGRGFKLVEILLCCHGGNRNDTIPTVEQRL